MKRPPIKYAKNLAGRNVAYWTFGEGPPDILWMSNFSGVNDGTWMWEPTARFLRGMSSIARTTHFDCSGTGGSDPIEGNRIPTLEDWMDEARIVMDAEGIERATLVGVDSGGPASIVFAATHPDRCAGLFLFNTFATLTRDDEYPFGYPAELRDKAIAMWLNQWGTGGQLALTAPSVADDEDMRDWMGFLERMSGPVSMRRPIFEMIAGLDVRPILPTLQVPTLVVHRTRDRWLLPEHGKYLAENIPGARYVEHPGIDHYPFFGDVDAVLAELGEFVTGVRADRHDEERVLATVLFTDIVDSTRLAAEAGDRTWRLTLDRHDNAVRDAIKRFRGREIKTMGDGFLATFDGPARAVRCAHAIRTAAGSLGLQIRAGLHCGEVELRGEDVGGISVHVGSRVAELADPGEVLVSQTVKDLTIGSDLVFQDRGIHELKGVPGDWRVYASATG